MKSCTTLLLVVSALNCGCVLGEIGDANAEEEIPIEDRPKFTKTDSGLEYRILRKGDGAKPGPTSTVEVHYKGWLDDGTEFDSSYKRNKSIEFPLNGVIPGWTEGMQLVSEGGKIELQVPPELGYGARGIPNVIPPNARLHFEVELIDVKK